MRTQDGRRCVKADTLRGVEQSSGGFVQREPAGRVFLKHAFACQVAEHRMQGIRVAACRGGKTLDVRGARRDVVGDPQRRRYADAPGRAEIAQRFEIRALLP
jgi:hypothetical protein